MFRQMAERIAPAVMHRMNEARWLKQDALEFPIRLQALSSIDAKVDFARSHPRLLSNQKRTEIIALLERVSQIRPRTVCEIGSDRGGTLGLFASVAAPDASILSLDIKYRPARVAAFPLLAIGSQTIRCAEADSHTMAARAIVQEWLGDRSLDFLFIDGDHSYDGVKADYEMYAPFVRPGGIVAFHDIVPDFFTRFGKKTNSNVGEVPRYWSELRTSVNSWEEFVEDRDQDGYGIGMICKR